MLTAVDTRQRCNTVRLTGAEVPLYTLCLVRKAKNNGLKK